jgi:nucleolar protein 53
VASVHLAGLSRVLRATFELFGNPTTFATTHPEQHGGDSSGTRAIQATEPQRQEGLAQKRRCHSDSVWPRRCARPDHSRVCLTRPHGALILLLTARSGVIAEKTSDELFAVDTVGSEDIRKAVSKRHKPLKVDEILAQRSAVPAVASRKRLSELDTEGKRKKAKVSGKEYDRLRAIAYGGEQVNKDVVQTGHDAEYDPWAVQETKKDPKFSFLEEKKAKREPVTLKHAPVSQAKSGKAIPAVRKPAGGKSYNPKFEDWQNELMRESDKAVEAEKKRLQEAREEAERMERAAAETESDSGEESVWESEWEGFSENEDDKLKTKRPERKSLSQRNKIKRRKEAERLARHESKMKAKEQQVQEIKKLAKSVEAKEKARAAVREALENKTLDVVSDDDGDEEELKRRQFRKHP